MNLFHNIRIISGCTTPKRLKVTYSTTRLGFKIEARSLSQLYEASRYGKLDAAAMEEGRSRI